MSTNRMCPVCNLPSVNYSRQRQQLVCTSSECLWTGSVDSLHADIAYPDMLAHIQDSLKAGLAAGRRSNV